MWASVSRMEEKLEPSGLVNCSGVSAAAAVRQRRLAQALKSYSRRISSGDIGVPHNQISYSATKRPRLAWTEHRLKSVPPWLSANRNFQAVFFSCRARMIGLTVRREIAAAHIGAVFAHSVGDDFTDIGIL